MLILHTDYERQLLDDGIEQLFGPIEFVLHDNSDASPHVDILALGDNDEFPFVKLVTSGISQRVRDTKDKPSAYRRFELVFCVGQSEVEANNFMLSDTVRIIAALSQYMSNTDTLYAPFELIQVGSHDDYRLVYLLPFFRNFTPFDLAMEANEQRTLFLQVLILDDRKIEDINNDTIDDAILNHLHKFPLIMPDTPKGQA